jgi:fibronectin type 3 domain-containing protein
MPILILSAVAAGLVVLQTQVQAGPPAIEVWHGAHQRFGQQGNPQRYINILGRVSDPDGIVSLTYTLNGGPPSALSIGSDSRRLVSAGDFNIDIHVAGLNSGLNQVVITALDNAGATARDTVRVEYLPGTIWPRPCTVDWSLATSIQEVAQVVDGEWRLEGGELRTAVPGYDRLVAIGDTSWSDYEVTVPVTIHSVAYQSGAGAGLLMRWTGHTDDPVPGCQPKAGWNPFGTISWWRWPYAPAARLELYGTNTSTDFTPILGVRYMLKARVETTADQGGLYRLKAWEASQPEPAGWMVQAARNSLAKGSLLLIAHFADVSFGNLTVVPVSSSQPADTTPPAAPANLTATAGDAQVSLDWADNTETDLAGYNVYRSGTAGEPYNRVNAAPVGASDYTDSGLAEGTTYCYVVRAVDTWGNESGNSAEVSATPTDTTPPHIARVAANGDSTQVIVAFSEPVQQTSAKTAANYAIDNGATVSAAAMGADSNIVVLTTSALSAGIEYALSVVNVQDRVGNTIAPNSRKAFAYARIQDEYQVDGNTIALYHFNGDLSDAGPNGLHLAAAGNAQLASDNLEWMALPGGQVLRVRDLGDQVTVPIPDDLVQPGGSASPLTIDARIYPRAYKAYSIGNYPVVSLYQDWDTRLEAVDGKWNSPRGPAVAVANQTLVSAEVWQDNVQPDAWHLLRIAFRANGAAEVYVDNHLIGAGAVSMNYDRTSDWWLTLGNFNGDLDEVRLSNAALPPAPSAPALLLAAPASSSRIDLLWTAAEGAESGIAFYRIYRNGAKVGTATSTAFGDTGLAAGTSYSYEVSAVNGAGLEGPRSTVATATTLPALGIAKPATGPGFGVDQNLPNPFNPSTTIPYTLPGTSRVRLMVYNVLGQQVRVLVDAEQEAGAHQAVWDGRDASGHTVSSGVYFYRLEAGPQAAVRRMVLTR